MQPNLIHQRWTGLALVFGLMLSGSMLFASGFSHLSGKIRLQLIFTIFQGPFGWDGYYQTRISRLDEIWFPLVSVGLLLAHPLKPTSVTLGLTLIGGFFWWIMGWWTMASGI